MCKYMKCLCVTLSNYLVWGGLVGCHPLSTNRIAECLDCSRKTERKLGRMEGCACVCWGGCNLLWLQSASLTPLNGGHQKPYVPMCHTRTGLGWGGKGGGGWGSWLVIVFFQTEEQFSIFRFFSNHKSESFYKAITAYVLKIF